MEMAMRHGVEPVTQVVGLWPVSTDVLVVHLGGNDLARHPGKALVLDIICNLKWLKAGDPPMRIMWFTIIPRLSWRDARFFLNVNMAHRGVN